MLPDLTGPNLRVGGAQAPTAVDAIGAAVLGRRVATRAGGGPLAGAPAHNAECLGRETSRPRVAESIAG